MESVSAGDAEIPALGVGTFELSGVECRRTVETALELGYRHVDTAEYYDNETAVGAGIERAPVDRDEVFLTTKVWRSNLAAEDVRPAVEASLDRLGVDYVDLLLIHWPHPRVPVSETLSVMEDLCDDGLVNHLGVSNFTRSQLTEAIDIADVPLVTDQVLYHPLTDQRALQQFCVDANVALTAYSPLARGAVVGREELSQIGQRYEKTAAQVAIRWLVQQEQVMAIPRSTSRDHLAQNLAVFDFELTDEEMTRIHELRGGLRIRLENKLPKLMRSLPI
ncbi:aldo/keto reductase [Salinibaculum salinum]|uniref:aldo/keto reductase n=1 Tax=Salinibaculum salinum TaxID=3131996 RepID=UPI0030EC5D28